MKSIQTGVSFPGFLMQDIRTGMQAAGAVLQRSECMLYFLSGKRSFFGEQKKPGQTPRIFLYRKLEFLHLVFGRIQLFPMGIAIHPFG